MTTIITKNSSTAGAAPTAGDLVQGELAVNVTDKALYTENASGTVVKLNTPSIIDNGNATAITIDSSENVGVGVTPSAWDAIWRVQQIGLGGSIFARTANNDLWISSNTYANSSVFKYINPGYGSAYVQTQGQHQWYNAPSGTAGATATLTQAMTLNASGNLGVGTSSPTSRLHIDQGGDSNGITLAYSGRGASTSIWQLSGGSNENSSFLHYNGTNTYTMQLMGRDQIAWSTNNTERARIDSSGNLLVGTTSYNESVVGCGFAASGSSYFTRSSSTNSTTTLNVYSTGAAAYRFYVGMGGTVYATNTTISSLSDIRFKENVRDLDAGLTEIMALKPRLYDWKEGKGADIKNARGFIAQEFETVFPDLIDTWKETPPEGEDPYKSVRADLIPVLVKAVQEQQTLIQDQLALINSLTARVEALENK